MSLLFYGIADNYKDVTEMVTARFDAKTPTLLIPADDFGRARLFGDPVVGKVKHRAAAEQKKILL